MPNPLKKQWQSLKQGQPGYRFQERYKAGQASQKNSDWKFKFLRLFRILAALALLVVGVVFVFIPGPAILFFFVAGGLLAAESLRIARFLDWFEVESRGAGRWLTRHWGRLHLAGKIAATGLMAAGATGFAYAAYRLVEKVDFF